MSSFAHNPTARILLADEDEITRAFLADNLMADGFTVQEAADYDAAVALLRANPVDLIVVDVNGNTLRLLDRVREGHEAVADDTPVIVLTSRIDEVHRIRCLDRGGDDILDKPFSYPELVARIRAVLRRSMPRRMTRILEAGPVRIDTGHRQVTVESRPVQLTATEYRLACTLAAEPNRVFTRSELTNALWGCQNLRGRTLDSHAYRLRTKLVSETCSVVHNVWGVGYRFLDPR